MGGSELLSALRLILAALLLGAGLLALALGLWGFLTHRDSYRRLHAQRAGAVAGGTLTLAGLAMLAPTLQHAVLLAVVGAALYAAHAGVTSLLAGVAHADGEPPELATGRTHK